MIIPLIYAACPRSWGRRWLVKEGKLGEVVSEQTVRPVSKEQVSDKHRKLERKVRTLSGSWQHDLADTITSSVTPCLKPEPPFLKVMIRRFLLPTLVGYDLQLSNTI